jgi:hypothetical protein
VGLPGKPDRFAGVRRLELPFCGGSAEFLLEPLGFPARLSAVVPRLRSHLTRYHGAFAANTRHYRLVVPALRCSISRVGGHDYQTAKPQSRKDGRQPSNQAR